MTQLHFPSVHKERVMLLLASVSLNLLIGYSPAQSAGLIELDSASRRSIRESEVDRYGSRNDRADSSNQNSMTSEPAVIVNNTVNASGEKKCVVKVGDVKTIQNNKGIRQENITYVDGSVINVCE